MHHQLHRAAPPGIGTPDHYTLLELPARIMGHREAIEAQAVYYRIGPRYRHRSDDPDEAVMIDLPPCRSWTCGRSCARATARSSAGR